MSLSNATPDAPLSQQPAVETDAIIIGAGPAGLFQAFQLGLQDIQCHLIDALPHVGGQCNQLYAPPLARCFMPAQSLSLQVWALLCPRH